MKTSQPIDRRTWLGGAFVLALMPHAASAAPFASSRLSVTVQGQGPDVILIHGVDSSRAVWNTTLPALAGHRIHLVQIAGFSGAPAGGNAKGPIVASLAAEVARYIADTRLIRPALIGHSMGGTIAMMVASRWPARIGKLMVVDMLPAPAGLLGGNAEGWGPFADRLAELFTATPQGRRGFESLMRMFGGSGATSDPDVTARSLRELAAIDLTPELPNIVAPMTVAFATPRPGTAITPAEIRQTYASAYRGAKQALLTPIADSGHMIMLDQPARFNAAVRTFLAAR
ncbi:alpha/beta fold hydrolase [Sphingomonas colocasiae]|uniref:Alpha/beta hydrolase n=1 Tax=Sphingomonas colocasiae TaxID=1848973 RepID=A0ABS7PMU4_9SPHN|nr:alpha/beta hydrolase [Sphingomonas colocasiae]MBY8822558.1 alpha/beta hydrolase [Sphingomonas colocasiae]